MSERWRDGACAVLLAAAAAAMYWEAVLLKGAFFVQDVMVQNYPFREFFAQALRQGDLPLWNPAINCGFPLFAEGQAGPLYPPNLIAGLLLPTWVGLTFAVVLHVWLAGLGVYGLLRALGCSRVAGLTGGLTYGLSGYLTVRAMSPNYLAAAAWVPVLFLLAEMAWQRRRWAWLVAVPGVVGLQFLAGHPQAAAYGAVAFVAYGLVRARSTGSGGWVAVAVPGLVVLGGMLAAAQLVPTAELVSHSTRGAGLGLDRFLQMSLPPERLVTLLLPTYFGNSGTGSYWGQEAGFFIQLCPYLGVLGLFLGLVAVLERRDPVTGFFAWMAGMGLVLSLGEYTGFFAVLYDVPGLSAFRIPSRFLLWWAVAGAALAGLGLDSVLRGDGARSRRRAVAMTLAVTGVAMVWFNGEVLGSVSGSPLAAAYGRDLARDAWRAALVLAAALILAEGGGRHPWLGLVAPAVVFADLYSFGHGFNSLVPARTYLSMPASARAVHQHLARFAGTATGSEPVPAVGRARCVSLVSESNSPWNWHSGWMGDLASYRAYPETLRMYTAGVYGLANTLPGWSPLHLRRHWELMSAYPAGLPAVNAAYVVSYAALDWPDLELIHKGKVRVYAWARALPRAFVVQDAVSVPAPGARLAYLAGPRFRPDREVVLSTPQRAGEGQGRGETPMLTAAVTRYEPERVVVDLPPGSRGYLVLSDTHYPGWRAEVDGERREILEANHAFRAVAVGPGDRHVTFTYAPISFRVGVGVSLLALVAWAGVLGWARRRPLKVGPSPAPLLPPWPAAVLQTLVILLLHSVLAHPDLWAGLLERSRFAPLP